MGETNKGLYGKYKIEKADGTPTDPNAQYFVLRADTDVHARLALRTYARSIQGRNPELARGIRQMLMDSIQTKAGQMELDAYIKEHEEAWGKLPKGSFFNP